MRALKIFFLTILVPAFALSQQPSPTDSAAQAKSLGHLMEEMEA